MEHRKQHTVPESYLTAWCDPETPEGQEPYVWRWSKDGTEVRRKAPRNIFYETEIYTLKTSDGSRDLRLEGMLSSLEAGFATIRREKLDRSVLPDSVERSTLITFVAALHARSAAQLRHLQSERNRVVMLAELIAEQAARATPEQRKSNGDASPATVHP